MSYLVLARKYRPVGFSSVSGQEHVTRTLSNAIEREKVVHAYLLTGPRGVGKTSVARILSKAINCQASSSAEPCLECQSCNEITAGTSMAVREIDGASHNSVDNVRDLMDSFKALPPPGYRYKVYIIDEVHMLSISAFNALLKSLEEPPPNTVFILATTEVHKIPDTVISRCQRHDFRALSVQVIEDRLAQVCREEGILADPESLRLIARLSDGSMRDAQTLLDRVQSFCSGPITAQDTSRALGTVERRALTDLTQAILRREVVQVLAQVSELFATGIDPTTLLREFVNYWRELFVAKLGGESRLLIMGLGQDSIVELLRLVSPLEAVDIQDLWDLAREGSDRCMRSAHTRYSFEALVVRMATRQPVAEIGEIIAQITSAVEPVRDSEPAENGSSLKATAVREAVGGALNKPAVTALQAPTAAPVLQNAAAAPELQVSGAAPARQLPSIAIVLHWDEFLRSAGVGSNKLFIENLKRVRVTRFEPGVIEGTGPEFNINTINREKRKFSDLLNEFLHRKEMAGTPNWKIAFIKGQGAADSVVQETKSKVRAESEEVQSHPALQSLQKIFPGSKVEQVRTKG